MTVATRIKHKIIAAALNRMILRAKKNIEKTQPRRLSNFSGYMLYKKLLSGSPAHVTSSNHNSVINAHIGNSLSFEADDWNVYAVHYCEKYCFGKEHEYIVSVENKNLQRFSFTGDRARKIYEHAKQYCR